MHFDNLSHLPEWDDDDFDKEEEEGEEWKPKPTRDACKKLYLQWQQVMMMLNGAIETMQVPEEGKEDEVSFPKEYWDDYIGMILGDGYQVAVKLKSSETGLYTIRMENASIIRKNAQYIYSALLTMMIENVIEEGYVMAIRKEIDVFRELFKHWVSTFEKDEYTDEWGLFI
jgi:hypothetical protein